MDRRTLLTASIAVIGSSVAGCLENRGIMGESTDPGGGDDPTDTDMNNPSDGGDSENGNGANDGDETDGNCSDDHETAKQSTICMTHFEIINIDTGILEESASVTFENHTVTVTGAILGSNSCYTARLEEVTIKDGTLIVRIESYEDVKENEGCFDSIVGIEYEMSAEVTDDLPTSVRVEHNGERVTTEQLS